MNSTNPPIQLEKSVEQKYWSKDELESMDILYGLVYENPLFCFPDQKVRLLTLMLMLILAEFAVFVINSI